MEKLSFGSLYNLADLPWRVQGGGPGLSESRLHNCRSHVHVALTLSRWGPRVSHPTHLQGLGHTAASEKPESSLGRELFLVCFLLVCSVRLALAREWRRQVQTAWAVSVTSSRGLAAPPAILITPK